ARAGAVDARRPPRPDAEHRRRAAVGQRRIAFRIDEDIAFGADTRTAHIGARGVGLDRGVAARANEDVAARAVGPGHVTVYGQSDIAGDVALGNREVAAEGGNPQRPRALHGAREIDDRAPESDIVPRRDVAPCNAGAG